MVFILAGSVVFEKGIFSRIEGIVVILPVGLFDLSASVARGLRTIVARVFNQIFLSSRYLVLLFSHTRPGVCQSNLMSATQQPGSAKIKSATSKQCGSCFCLR